jgi:2-iminobutanoate/2-iminopropanoate deaminase
MQKQAFASPDGAPAVGPYSPALAAGDLVFVSGQIALAADGSVVGVTAAEQARKALENMQATLAAANLEMGAVVKTTIFLDDMGDFAAVNEIYAQFFSEPYPARSTVEVSRLPKDLKVEIEAIAVRGGDR